ncbi:sugar O-acyltransferase (sialic acid O-acetyltransferase NeuD family) [Dysgonomonadaceae bacterium PH5-43]|nr:sugar O-acyltransferase (sialic acid O-acetyltransferase NeuD family) [Dysgonomonadaceae bacterium PH5-43]
MKKAIIIGAGTYGQVYAEYLKKKYDIIGYVDDAENLQGQIVNGIKVIGNRTTLLKDIERNVSVFAPIGNNAIRTNLLEELTKEGFETPSFIHPNTIIHESVILGKAIYILPGTNIMPCTEIKDFTMISMGVNIAHHNLIEKGCFFSQGSNIGASIHINEQAYFGIASTAMTGIKEVGKNTLIGAGAVVIKDVPDNAVVAGVPAKVLKFK